MAQSSQQWRKRRPPLRHSSNHRPGYAPPPRWYCVNRFTTLKIVQASTPLVTRMDGHNPFLSMDEDTLRKLLFHHEYSASSIRAALKARANDALEDPPAKMFLDEVAKLENSFAALESSTEGSIT